MGEDENDYDERLVRLRAQARSLRDCTKLGITGSGPCSISDTVELAEDWLRANDAGFRAEERFNSRFGSCAALLGALAAGIGIGIAIAHWWPS